MLKASNYLGGGGKRRREGGGGVVVFSLFCFPEVEVAWVDAPSFKVEAIFEKKKKLISILHSAQKKKPIRPHNIYRLPCYIISRKKQFGLKKKKNHTDSHGNKF